MLTVLMCLSAFAALAPEASGELREYCNDVDNLPSPRTYCGVLSMGNTIYVIGGFTYDLYGTLEPSLDTVLMYDTMSGEISYGAPMPNGTALGGYVVGADGLIYSLGGWNSTLGGYIPTVQIYDPMADEWTFGSDAPIEVGGCEPVACSDGRVFIFGPMHYMDNSTLIYDTAVDEWSFGADQPVDLWLRNAVLWNETAIYVLGGTDGIGGTTYADVYNPMDDTWSTAAPLPSASSLGTVEVSNDFVYYIGGTSGDWADVGVLSSAIVKYDPSTDSWDAATTGLPTARSALYSAVDNLGRIFVIGGYDGVEVVPTVTRLVVAEIETDKLMITSPADGSIVSGVVSVEASVSNFWMGFSNVDLYVDGELAESRILDWPSWEAATFQWDTTGLEDGSVHELLVIGYLWNGEEKMDSVSVTVWTMSVEERIAGLELDLMGLEAQLAAVEIAVLSDLADQAADLATLQSLVDALQAALDALATSVDEDNAAMAADLAALQSQLDTLESALDDMRNALDDAQSSVDDVQDSVDDLTGDVNETQNSVDDVQDSVDDVAASVDNKMDGMLGYAIIGLLAVVILLMVVMMVMGRKPKAPAPLPEPPID